MKDITERKELLEKALIMKRNVRFCLMQGEKQGIIGRGRDAYGTPVLSEGEILVPTAPIERFALTPIRSDLTLADDKGRRYSIIPLSAVPELTGLKYDYDDMGLIVISKEGDLICRETDLDLMMSLMKRFVFEYATAEEIFSDAKKHTEGFKHPYVLGNADTFARLKAAYDAEEGDACYDSRLKGYIATLVRNGDRHYKNLAKAVAEDDYSVYVGMNEDKIPKNPNDDPFGYDVGGRLGVPAGCLPYIAFAALMSGDVKYAKLAFDYSVALGEWDHWGPGHFLNCADSTAPFAIALDWLYNTYTELAKEDPKYSPTTLEDICFKNGVEMGYLASLEQPCPWPSPKIGQGGFVYHKKVNNWNAVCTSGMTVGALVIMGNENYSEKAAALISDGLYHLAHHGLGQYVPDGSYIESPGYWCYGTNTLFRMIAVLLNSCGTDYGYLDTWGLDKTCYFAVNAESSDYRAWNYHDGGTQSLDTSWFNFMAEASGDEGLRSIRNEQLSRGKSVQLQDLVYYKNTTGEVELPLSYHMQGIDGFAARSDWSKGALYTGILGAGNHVPHGQTDAGTFVYHNKGIIWLCDMGADNYNVHAYWGKPYYYRRNAEGNNVLCLVNREDVPFGQLFEGTGKITEVFDNGENAYAKMDNVTAFGEGAKRVDRGLLLTEDRSVVVIQDELAFEKEQSAYWFAHYDKNEIKSVSLSEDGRQLYMSAVGNDEKEYTLRLSIAGDDSLTFSLTSCYDFVLPATYRPGTSESLGGQPEHSRESFGRIAVALRGCSEYSFAVVIEMVNEEKDAPVSYKWQQMSAWSDVFGG